jgi:hypothetical protein
LTLLEEQADGIDGMNGKDKNRGKVSELGADLDVYRTGEHCS